jgi:acetyl esterase/lipase
MKHTILAILLASISINGFSQDLRRLSEKRNEFILKNYDQIKQRQATNPNSLPSNIKIIRDVPYAQYSKDNTLDIYYEDSKTSRKPVVIMVHGGDWLVGDKAASNIVVNKASYFVNQQDYIFISVNYRMEKNNIHPQEVSDVAEAIHWVHRNIKNYGGNPNKIILMGHSAGAHLVSLVATDPRYLNKVDTPIFAIKGVVSLDTGGFDLPYLLKSEQLKNDMGDNIIAQKSLEKVRSVYNFAWGNYSDAVLNDASPINYVSGNIPPFLLLQSSKNKSHQIIGDKFEKVFKSKLALVYRKDFPYSHEEMNELVGTPDDITTTIQQFIDKFIR